MVARRAQKSRALTVTVTLESPSLRAVLQLCSIVSVSVSCPLSCRLDVHHLYADPGFLCLTGRLSCAFILARVDARSAANASPLARSPLYIGRHDRLLSFHSDHWRRHFRPFDGVSSRLARLQRYHRRRPLPAALTRFSNVRSKQDVRF